MNPPSLANPPPPCDPAPRPLRARVSDAFAYWERNRAGYNAVLAFVTLAWLLLTWPHFGPALNRHSGLLLLVLAVLANVCYCAAYPVDIMLQGAFRTSWTKKRWVLWWAGSALAVAVACYWIADEIYPFVG